VLSDNVNDWHLEVYLSPVFGTHGQTSTYLSLNRQLPGTLLHSPY